MFSRGPGYARFTNFYPLYGAANDQVDPVLRVQPVLFQRVIPRYRLSTSETRDQGLGPMFADIPENPVAPGPAARRRVAAASVANADRGAADFGAADFGAGPAAGPAPEPWLGRRVDLYA